MAEQERWKVRAQAPSDLGLRELHEKGRGFCKWCGETVYRVDKDGRVVQDRRRTWHEGREVHPDAEPEPNCVREYLDQAFTFRDAVGRRDGYTCQRCGLDVAAAIEEAHAARRAEWDRLYALPDDRQHTPEWWEAYRANSRSPIPEWHADHVIPLEDGGAHEVANGQVLCAPCHHAKTAQEARERAARRRGDLATDQLEMAA